MMCLLSKLGPLSLLGFSDQTCGVMSIFLFYWTYCSKLANIMIMPRSHCGDVYWRICAILKFVLVGSIFLVHLHCSPPFSMDRHLATTVSNCSKLSPVFADSWPFFSSPLEFATIGSRFFYIVAMW